MDSNRFGKIPLLAICALWVSGCGGGGGDSSPAAPSASPPGTPTINITPQAPKPGQLVTFTAQSSNPQGGIVTYQWSFGDGASLAGGTASHTYQAEGSYTVSVMATNSQSLSANASTALDVAYPPPNAPSVSDCPTQQYANQFFSCTAQATDPSGLVLNYSWDFGDQTVASGASVSHLYATPGTYSIAVKATNSAAKSSTTTASLSVLAPTTSASQNNLLEPYCSGPLCGAIDANTYSGNGIGIWRYNNTTTSSAVLNIALAGVHAGQSVTLVFSNGEATAATALPDWGALSVPAPALFSSLDSAPENDKESLDRDRSHSFLLEENRQLAVRVIDELGAFPKIQATAIEEPRRFAAPPPVGTSRTWRDNYGVTVQYPTTVHYTCPLKTGRNAVFWIDPNVTSFAGFKEADLALIETTFCGSTGGYARLADMMGDAWGTAANASSFLIKDAAGTLKDIHVVIILPPEGTGWAGYFYSLNNYLQSTFAMSNQELAFFINGRFVSTNTDYTASALVHEAAHMINFYQRTVQRSTVHDTWLEETSAMMAEDIVTPAVHPAKYNPAAGRVFGYLASGAGLSYINWPSGVDSSYYNVGGAFGAFLNRRFGPSLDSQLVTSCNDGSTGNTSYTCLHNLLIAKGSQGYSDEFARFGASVLGGLPATGLPWGFGYPGTSIEGYDLPSIAPSAFIASRPAVADALTSGYTATTQTYRADVIAVGKTSYERPAMVVPAKTSLMIVVK